jgi:chaperonin GroEL
MKALEEPLRQIVNNAGLEGSVVLQKVKEGKDDFGFNAATEQYEKLIKSGVIDPTKVTRTALENAASVAALLITTEAVVYEKKEKEPAMPSMPPGGMGGMDY